MSLLILFIGAGSAPTPTPTLTVTPQWELHRFDLKPRKEETA